jgi:hypothetical protein
MYVPIARQDDALVHDTPLRTVKVPPAGRGLPTTRQDQPFQDSMSPHVVEVLSLNDPTAMQDEALLQETALRTLETAPFGFGLGITDHAEPFHSSVRPRTTPSGM